MVFFCSQARVNASTTQLDQLAISARKAFTVTLPKALPRIASRVLVLEVGLVRSTPIPSKSFAPPVRRGTQATVVNTAKMASSDGLHLPRVCLANATET